MQCYTCNFVHSACRLFKLFTHGKSPRPTHFVRSPVYLLCIACACSRSSFASGKKGKCLFTCGTNAKLIFTVIMRFVFSAVILVDGPIGPRCIFLLLKCAHSSEPWRACSVQLRRSLDSRAPSSLSQCSAHLIQIACFTFRPDRQIVTFRNENKMRFGNFHGVRIVLFDAAHRLSNFALRWQ